MWAHKVVENPSAWSNQEYGGILCLRGEDCSLQLSIWQHCLVCQSKTNTKGFPSILRFIVDDEVAIVR